MEIEQIPNLTLGAAEHLVDAALAAARVAAVPICVAVVDRAGLPLVFKRMPGAPLHSVDIALDKAYTAVSFGRPTGDWQNRLEKGSEMLRLGLMQRPRFVGFGGGLPVLHAGVRVGAIGISGGSEAQDIAFAESALAAG